MDTNKFLFHHFLLQTIMNEYTILFLNGITKYVTTDGWKDAILMARGIAEKQEFNSSIKMIIDGEGESIKNINEQNLTFQYSLNETLKHLI